MGTIVLVLLLMFILMLAGYCDSSLPAPDTPALPIAAGAFLLIMLSGWLGVNPFFWVTAFLLGGLEEGVGCLGCLFRLGGIALLGLLMYGCVQACFTGAA